MNFEFIGHWLRRWDIFIESCIFCRASNSKSSYSLTSISSLSALMLHFSKQFLIVMLVTSFHASCSHQIATITSTPLKTFVADASSWMLASIFLKSLFQYLTLKFWMIPASSGCSLEVVFFGKKLIFICKN